MNKIFCFGEPLLRMSPSLGGKWISDASLPVYMGGSELNVATALAAWKIPVKFGAALPDNYLAKDMVQSMSEKGIDVSSIHFSGNKIGIYFIPSGADLQNRGVIYDREGSSFAELSPGMINWEEALKDCDWFHFSAISPALNKNAAAVCKEALYYAAQKKMTISADLNYRPSLWQFDKKPIQVMPELVQYCQVLMGNLWSASTLLGITVDDDIHQLNSKKAYLDHARRSSQAIFNKVPNCRIVANTFRFNEGEGLHYYASLDEKESQWVSMDFQTKGPVNRIGSGDCFMAGLIYGIRNSHASQDVINYAAAAAFGKLQEKGDATAQSIESVRQLMKEYEQA